MRLLSPIRLVLVAALACWASTAHAQWTRHHGSECLPANADEVDTGAAFVGTAGAMGRADGGDIAGRWRLRSSQALAAAVPIFFF